MHSCKLLPPWASVPHLAGALEKPFQLHRSVSVGNCKGCPWFKTLGGFTRLLQRWSFFLSQLMPWLRIDFQIASRSISKAYLSRNPPPCVLFLAVVSSRLPLRFCMEIFCLFIFAHFSLCFLVQTLLASHLDYCNSFFAGF